MPPKACSRSSSARSGALGSIFLELVERVDLEELAKHGSEDDRRGEDSRSQREASPQGPIKGRQVSRKATRQVQD